MFNPLLSDPTKLKDQDLENKILDLSRKYQIAMRLGNGSVAQQIVLTLDTYKIEQQRRQAENMQALQKKSRDQGLDDLINVD
jgi:hypothetical protein